MNIDKVQKLIEYCIIRCGSSNCIWCKGINEGNCEGVFLLDFFDIIDLKTLEQNNINKILTDIYDMYVLSGFNPALTLMEYTILNLFIDDRYKVTKKKDCDEMLEKVLNI